MKLPLGMMMGALVGTVMGCGGAAPDGSHVESTVRGADLEVATLGDEVVALSDVEARVQDKLREIRVKYELDRHGLLTMALDAELEERVLNAEVERRGLDSLDALLEIEVEGKTPEPSVEKLREAFIEFQQQVPAARFEEASAHLAKELRRVEKDERYKEFVAELKTASNVHVALPYPDIPAVDVRVRSHNPRIGPDSAEVTLVQFTEFQCYYCRQVAPNIDRLVAQFGDSLRVVFKDFPLRGHRRARRASIAARCAGRQGQYWPLAEELFKEQAHIPDERLRGMVESLGLDVSAWSRCLEESIWNVYIDEDVRDGMAVGVNSTPTFFVNGLMVTGSQPYERLAALVEQQLENTAVAGN